MKSSSSATATPSKHLYFVMTLHDPVHSLRFSTVSQPSPADWLDVEYDSSDWVEERLVEVLRTGVEIVAQDVSATLSQTALMAVRRDENGLETVHNHETGDTDQRGGIDGGQGRDDEGSEEGLMVT